MHRLEVTDPSEDSRVILSMDIPDIDLMDAVPATIAVIAGLEPPKPTRQKRKDAAP